MSGLMRPMASLPPTVKTSIVSGPGRATTSTERSKSKTVDPSAWAPGWVTISGLVRASPPVRHGRASRRRAAWAAGYDAALIVGDLDPAAAVVDEAATHNFISVRISIRIEVGEQPRGLMGINARHGAPSYHFCMNRSRAKLQNAILAANPRALLICSLRKAPMVSASPPTGVRPT